MSTETQKAAKVNKKDEFYTRIEDISEEVGRYTWKNKVVYLPADNPKHSNFWKFFCQNFYELELKEVIATYYDDVHPVVATSYNGKEVKTVQLKSTGDFRSEECSALLQICDVVCTNPPFSLIKEFVPWVLNSNKDLLFIGTSMAATYKDVFPFIKTGRLHAGYFFNKNMEFIMPDTYELKGKAYVDEHGNKHGFVPGICWWTTLNVKGRGFFNLKCKYDAEKHPRYDNYDAIEVSKAINIPYDYEGVMGVPISFLSYYNPDQFEIVGMMSGAKGEGLTTGNDGRPKFYVNGEGVFARLLIKRRTT